jgi:peptide/nickel transport system permease protein
MIAAIARRLTWTGVVVLFAVSITFAILHAVPGDPARTLVGPHATEETLAHARKHHGLEQSLPAQYLRYLGQIARGDLGESYRTHRPVRDLLVEHTWPTLQLVLAAVMLQVALGLPLGAWAARGYGRWPDHAAAAVSVLGQAAPPFVLGTALLYLVGHRLGWLPVDGYGDGLIDRLRHLVLPAFTVAAFGIATYAQLIRTELHGALGQDYVRTARAKGLSERTVLWRHALYPVLPPLISAIGVDLGVLLTGAVVVESIFGWPGLGREALLAVLELDLPLILGVVISTSLAIAAINLLADLALLAIDPRGRA